MFLFGHICMRFLRSKCGKVALSAEDDKRIVGEDGIKHFGHWALES